MGDKASGRGTSTLPRNRRALQPEFQAPRELASTDESATSKSDRD
jgi:hypothetical protein